MNSDTHKAYVINFMPLQRVFVIPTEWHKGDITIKYKKLYYKNKLQNIIPHDFPCDPSITEEDLDEWFDCIDPDDV